MNWQEQTVMVTGAAGFIGSNLCDALLTAGARVIGLDDLSVGKRENLTEAEARGLQFIRGNILEPTTWSSQLSPVTQVIHMAVACLRKSFQDPLAVHHINATGTLTVLEACRLHAPKLQRFVYCSSSEVYGSACHIPMSENHPLQPTTVYGASKLAGEIYSLSSQLPVTVVRPFNTYGPREHHQGASGEMIPRCAVRIANGLAPLIFGDGSQTRDFTYVTDTARGLMLACASSTALGKTINLARGQEVSIIRVAEILLQKMGARELKPLFRNARPLDVTRHYAATDLARQILGFEAQIDIETGLEYYLNWFQQNHAKTRQLLEEVQEQNW